MNAAKSKQKTDDLLKLFAYGHLPPNLQGITKPFAELAHHIVDTLPANLRRKMALQKLLEAKDWAERALREE